jgi:hypothetical protein
MNNVCGCCEKHSSNNQRFFASLSPQEQNLMQAVLCLGCAHNFNNGNDVFNFEADIRPTGISTRTETLPSQSKRIPSNLLEGKMMIQVQYTDGRYDIIKASHLDILLEKFQIIRFRRSSGWAVIGRDSVRKKSHSPYSGPERRALN